MKFIILLIFTSNILLACGNPKIEKQELKKETQKELEIKTEKDNLSDKGFEKALEIMSFFKNKDYDNIRNSFYEPIAKKVPENILKQYTDKASLLIAEYGIPKKEKVINQVSFSKINEPQITKETNVELLVYMFPMPSTERNEPPLRMITISFLPSIGFDKIVAFNVLDNSKRSTIKPDFEKLINFNLNLTNFKRIRIYNTNKGNDKALNQKISELDNEKIKSLNKILNLINKANIEKTETTSDITRYKSNPETISLHLNPYEKMMMMPNEITKTYFMITEILENETDEKESEWIIIRQFKTLTSSYLYYLNKTENKELYNELKKLKNYTR